MERSGGSGKRQCFPYQAKRGLKPGEIMGNEHKGMLFGAELNNLMLKGIFQDE